MKKIFVLLFVLFSQLNHLYSECFEGCDNPEYNLDSVRLDIPNSDCYIVLKYKHRVLNCPDGEVYDLQVVTIFAAIDSSCEFLEDPYHNGDILYETAIQLLLGDPTLNPFPNFPQYPNCVTTYQVAGPSCWEYVYKPFHPMFPGLWLVPCQSTPLCCRKFKVCVTTPPPFSTVVVTPLPYTFVPCTTIIGPETNQPCISTCQ